MLTIAQSLGIPCVTSAVYLTVRETVIVVPDWLVLLEELVKIFSTSIHKGYSLLRLELRKSSHLRIHLTH